MRYVGVYDADGSVLGELSYFVGARLGRTHCSLCTITHGLVRERASWRACRDALDVPFVTYHRDDQPAAVRAVGAALPVVLAELDDGSLSIVATAAQLEACDGSPECLVELLGGSAD